MGGMQVLVQNAPPVCKAEVTALVCITSGTAEQLLKAELALGCFIAHHRAPTKGATGTRQIHWIPGLTYAVGAIWRRCQDWVDVCPPRSRSSPAPPHFAARGPRALYTSDSCGGCGNPHAVPNLTWPMRGNP